MNSDSEPSAGEILLYRSAAGEVRVECLFKDETIWQTQKGIAALFEVQVPAISKHFKNIFDSGELIEGSVVSILETTAADGKKYAMQYYRSVVKVIYRYTARKLVEYCSQVIP